MKQTPKFQYEAWRVDYEDIAKIRAFIDYIIPNTAPLFQVAPGISEKRGGRYCIHPEVFHYRNSSLSVGISIPGGAETSIIALLFVGLAGKVEEDSNELIAAMVAQGLERGKFSKRKIGIED